MKRVMLKDIKLGEVNKVAGFVENIRNKKWMCFIVLRDVSGKLQLTIEKETGARGLRALMEKILVPVMYSAPSDPTVDVIKITADVVDGKSEPIIARKTIKDETQAS